MIDGKRVIAIVPARGGSKGIPKKNLAILGGNPLISWPIKSGQVSACIDRTIVSTECGEIANVARKFGAEVYMRPIELAQDNSLVIDALRDLHKRLTAEGEANYIMVLLEGTSPFRSPELVDDVLHEFIHRGLSSIATFHELEVPAERIWTIVDNKPKTLLSNVNPWLPRQAGTPVHILNGCVYAFYPEQLSQQGTSLLVGNWGSYVMKNEDLIDIDTEKDLRIANAILSARNIT